jgi:hypothetical protein
MTEYEWNGVCQNKNKIKIVERKLILKAIIRLRILFN